MSFSVYLYESFHMNHHLGLNMAMPLSLGFTFVKLSLKMWCRHNIKSMGWEGTCRQDKNYCTHSEGCMIRKLNNSFWCMSQGSSFHWTEYVPSLPLVSSSIVNLWYFQTRAHQTLKSILYQLLFWLFFFTPKIVYFIFKTMKCMKTSSSTIHNIQTVLKNYI